MILTLQTTCCTKCHKCGLLLPRRGGYGRVMDKSVQWMTLQELRDEFNRTRPAWDELADLDDVPDDDELPALRKDARCHELVLHELLRRPNNG